MNEQAEFSVKDRVVVNDDVGIGAAWATGLTGVVTEVMIPSSDANIFTVELDNGKQWPFFAWELCLSTEIPL